MLVAPSRKHFTFTLGSYNVGRDALCVFDSEYPELANQHRGPVFIRDTTARELFTGSIERIAKHRDSRCDTVTDEIRGFESSCGAGVDRDDDDLGGLHSSGHDEHASGGSQNRLTKEKNSKQDRAGER